MNPTPNIENAIIEKITPVFREVFEDENLTVHRNLDPSQVEAWDSLNHITLIVELEKILEVQFTTDELASLVNVGDLIDCVMNRG